jgi:hypothetical protein
MLAKARNENTALADTTRQRIRSQETQDPAKTGSRESIITRFALQALKSENDDEDVNALTPPASAAERRTLSAKR